MVCWKGKEEKKKRRTRGKGGPGRAIAHFGSSVMKEKVCRDRVSCVATGSQAACTTRPGCAQQDACATEPPGSMLRQGCQACDSCHGRVIGINKKLFPMFLLLP